MTTVFTIIFALIFVWYDGLLHEFQKNIDLSEKSVLKEWDNIKHAGQAPIFILFFAGMFFLDLPTGFTRAILILIMNLVAFGIVFSAFFNTYILDKDAWYLGEGDWDRFWDDFLGEKGFFIIKIVVFTALLAIILFS